MCVLSACCCVRSLDEALLLLLLLYLRRPRPLLVRQRDNARYILETPTLTAKAQNKHSRPFSVTPSGRPTIASFLPPLPPSPTRKVSLYLYARRFFKQTPRSRSTLLPPPTRTWTKKVDVWLDRADRFKNGAIQQEAVKTVIRDALLINGLPSPRESDLRLTLQHTSTDNQGLQFDRSKLGVELKHLIRNALLRS